MMSGSYESDECGADTSNQMMSKLLPILLYIRNYNEYNRHKPTESMTTANKVPNGSQPMQSYYEAEASLAARRRARAEARAIRLKEWEKRRNESTTETAGYSRRRSDDSLGDQLADGRQYRRRSRESVANDEKSDTESMANGVQSDSERQSLFLAVQTYKDDLEELEENIIRCQKDYKDKCQSFDEMNAEFKKLEEECDYYNQRLRQRERLIEEAGLVPIEWDEWRDGHRADSDRNPRAPNGLNGHSSESISGPSLVSREVALLLADVEGRRSRESVANDEKSDTESMANGVQSDSERQSLFLAVQTYKDDLEELEENIIRCQKDYKDKCQSFDEMNAEFKKLEEECDYYNQRLRQRERLISEAGLVPIEWDEWRDGHRADSDRNPRAPNGLNGHSSESISGPSLVSREVALLLADVEGVSLTAKIDALLNGRQSLAQEMASLTAELDDERQRTADCEALIAASSDGSNTALNEESNREANKVVADYKLKVMKREQEISVLTGNVSRLETQLSRYKTAADEAQELEDELKAEKRKTQRELREALARIEELETSGAHLQKRIDKLMTNRNISANKAPNDD
ncbi:unnamed protein product [Oppiella nova]|uniref:Leucine-rich repeat flightless-interacting protein 2 n=2 Tax=Oppiella nova TaxID=334625 RepID=A0A7R9LF57_9ACAR|nr:unnamed protein product [Oppiella nova]CAG2162922.1 unnamed protein product [Oppiella nova]